MAIDSNGYRCRKDGTLIESEPVGVMVISHLLNYPNPLQSSVSLYRQLSQWRITVRSSADKQLTELKNWRGIDEDHWGRRRTPRDQLQPNTNDLIPSGTVLTEAPIWEHWTPTELEHYGSSEGLSKWKGSNPEGTIPPQQKRCIHKYKHVPLPLFLFCLSLYTQSDLTSTQNFMHSWGAL
jgi:hypothetical protein